MQVKVGGGGETRTWTVFSGFIYSRLLSLPQACVQLSTYVCIYKGTHWMCLIPTLCLCLFCLCFFFSLCVGLPAIASSFLLPFASPPLPRPYSKVCFEHWLVVIQSWLNNHPPSIWFWVALFPACYNQWCEQGSKPYNTNHSMVSSLRRATSNGFFSKILENKFKT